MNPLLHITRFSFFILLFSFFSCDDLERLPPNRITIDNSFESMKDAQTWNVGSYAKLRDYQGLILYNNTDIQADQLNLVDKTGVDDNSVAVHSWSGFQSNNRVLETFWRRNYSAILHANTTIDGYERIPVAEEEEEQLNQYKGVSHFLRAYSYFQLIKRYAKHYHSSSADTDLGVPLNLGFDPNIRLPRSSVQEVYDQILIDVELAEEYLSSTSNAPGSHVLNSHAAKALNATVHFNMGNWEKANQLAKELIQSGDYTLAQTADEIKNMWHNDQSNEVIFQLHLNPGEQERIIGPGRIYLGVTQTETGDIFSPSFIPSQWVIDMYADDDFRKDVYFRQDTIDVDGLQVADIYMVNKFPGNPALFTQPRTNYQNEPKLFRLAEMYLIAAESAYMMDNHSEAQSHLNTLREARNLEAVSVTGEALFGEIRNERFRELAFEGLRLDDLKRWNEGFQRRDPQSLEAIVEGQGTHQLEIPADHPKFTWGIPANDLKVDFDIIQNDGW